MSRPGSKELCRQGSKEFARQGSKGQPGHAGVPRRHSSKQRHELAGLSVALDDEDPATWLVNALSGPPERRSEAQVLEALSWWQNHLPASGAELAVELRAPEHVLLEVFRRGRVLAYEAGKRLQEEGDEVRSYTIIMMGRCKLRCDKPYPLRVRASPVMDSASHLHFNIDPTEEELIACGALDSDGLVPLGEVNRGESLGMFPGDPRATYEVTCTERTTVLLLGREDYEAVLKPFQKEVHAQAIDYLQRHGLCPEASFKNLEWLAHHMKHKKVQRGRTIMRAGDPHRTLWFLRGGSCSIIMDTDTVNDIMEQHPQEGDVEVEEAESEDEEEAHDPVELALMRATACGGTEVQNRAAAEHKRNKIISKYARGPMRSSLQNPLHAAESDKQGAHRSAAVVKPGSMLGEEALLFDPRDLVAAKCSYTVTADQDCSFYVADFTTWRQLSNFIGPDGIAQTVHEQLQRRSMRVARSRIISKRLDRKKRRMHRFELNKEDRQKVRLPGSTGTPGPAVCDDINDYLKIVFDHRRGPRDLRNLPTLSALDGTKFGPSCPSNGPAVNKLLKVVGGMQEMSSKKYGENLRSLHTAPGRRQNLAHDDNPMGECVPAEALTYYEREVQDPLRALPPSAPAVGELSRISSQPSGMSGIFSQTEVDAEVTLLQSSSVPLLPRVPGSTLAESSPGERNISTAPAAPDMGGLDAEDATLRPDSSMFDSFGSPARPSTSGSAGGAGTRELRRSQQKRSPAAERQTKMMKAFARASAKKTVLVLTEKADVQKNIMRSFLAGTMVDLCFVKTSSATWQRLQDPKESFHALIWDLTKSEVTVNTLLKNIRTHDRYSGLPIVVLSSDREISDTVRLACSFVVFHPIAPAMLREALLWCFDRKALTGMANKQETTQETVDPFDFLVVPGKSMDAWTAETSNSEAKSPPLRSALKSSGVRQVPSETSFAVSDV